MPQLAFPTLRQAAGIWDNRPVVQLKKMGAIRHRPNPLGHRCLRSNPPRHWRRSLPDGRQILFAIASQTPGITIPKGSDLIALTASQTGPVQFENVFVDPSWLLTDPAEQVLTVSGVTSTGSTQTSALALGLATSAVNFIEQESLHRPDLLDSVEALKNNSSF